MADLRPKNINADIYSGGAISSKEQGILIGFADSKEDAGAKVRAYVTSDGLYLKGQKEGEEDSLIVGKQDISTLSSEIDSVNSKLTASIASTKSDLESEIDAVECRVLVNESNIATNKTGIEENATAISSNASDISALKSEVDDSTTGLKALYNKIEGVISEGGEPNVIDGIKVNGVAVEPDENKVVDISVPTDYLTASDLDGYAKTADITSVNNGILTINAGESSWSFGANSADDTPVNLAKIASTGSYNDLSDVPAGETIGDAIITIQRNSTTIGSFTTNATDAQSINIIVPTTVGELSDSGNYATASTVSGIDSRLTTVEDKIDGIVSTGGEANIIVQVEQNGTPLIVTNRTVNVTVPTAVSELINDSAFITKAVSNLENYYLKTETYSKDEINDLVSGDLKFEKVDSLASVSSPSATTIYLIPASTTGTNNIYDEYLYMNRAWEKIGSSEIDLSGYLTTSEASDTYATKASLATVATSGKYSDLSGTPSLSYSESGTGNVITALSVAGHSVTVTKGITALTSYTDTKNTAGASNDTTNNLYIIGATSQTDGIQTYSKVGAYINASGDIYSNSSKVLTTADTIAQATKAIQDGNGNVITSTYATQSTVNTKASKPLIFSNASVTWASDSTNTDFPYKGTITASGMTSAYVPTVVFSQADATSGNYSPVCTSDTDAVYIYSKVNTLTTVPTVVGITSE